VKKILFLILLSVVSLLSYDATIDIVKKADKLPAIVVQDATGADFANQKIDKKTFKLLIGDLKVSTNFIVDDNYTTSTYDGDFDTNIQNSNGLDLVLRYKLEDRDNALIGRVKLIDAKNGSLLTEKTYEISDMKRYPFFAHRVVADVSKYVGGSSVDWMDNLVIFAKSTGKMNSDIVVSDYTLTYQKTVISGGLNIFPKWADDSRNSFYYTSFGGRIPVLYKVDLISGQKHKIISCNGMLICSDVSKDGRRLLLTMAPDDQPDVYLYDLNTKKKERLTKYSGIDVSGHFIDNETRFAFVSDRLGYPNIFAKGLNINSPVEQMIYQGRNNTSFSSYDNYIVFSRREDDSEFGKNSFNLYLISTKTEYIRQLTATGKNYFPRFANHGETILFIKNYKWQSALGIIRLYSNKSFLFPLKVGKIQSIDW